MERCAIAAVLLLAGMIRCEEITWSATVPLWKSLSTEGGFVTAHDGPVWGPVWQAAGQDAPVAEPVPPVPVAPKPLHPRRTSPVPAGEPDALPLGIAQLILKPKDLTSFATMIEQVDARPIQMPKTGQAGGVTVEPLAHTMLPGVVISKPLGTVRPWLDEPETDTPAPQPPQPPRRTPQPTFNRTVYRNQTVPVPAVVRTAEQAVHIPLEKPVVRNPILPDSTPETRSPYHQLPMPAPRPFHPETVAATVAIPKTMPEEKPAAMPTMPVPSVPVPSVPVPSVPVPAPVEVREPILAKLGLPK